MTFSTSSNIVKLDWIRLEHSCESSTSSQGSVGLLSQTTIICDKRKMWNWDAINDDHMLTHLCVAGVPR